MADVNWFDFKGDALAKWKGWHIILSNKLYYDSKTQQFYGREGEQLTFGQVERIGIDPMNPFKETAPLGERTKAVQKWQEAGGERPAELRWQPSGIEEPTEQTELEKLAASMGVTAQDLLRKKYGFPTSAELEAEQYEAEIADWQRKTEAQYGMWGDWQREQEVDFYRRAALSQGIGRRMEARTQSQWQPQGANRGRIWEATQREMIGQLDPARDWLKIRDIKQRRNPYITDPESATDDRHIAEMNLDKAKSWVKTADALLATAKDPQTQLTKEEMDYVYRAYDAKRVAARKLAEAQQGEQDWIEEQGVWASAGEGGTGVETATGIMYGGGAPPRVPKPTTPKVPDWLEKAYPDLGVKTKWGMRMPTKEQGYKGWIAPSGQWWSARSPSQRQQWMGAVSYYQGKQKPLDLLWQTERMLPRTPPQPRYWTPAEQRA